MGQPYYLRDATKEMENTSLTASIRDAIRVE
jgi:hypothetical protein